MIGRKAYADPWWLTSVGSEFLADRDAMMLPTRAGVVASMATYARRENAAGTRLHHVSRHLLGLYHGQPGARTWRRALTLGAAQPGAGPEVLLRALDQVEGRGGGSSGGLTGRDLLATGT
jgi:tRNA-dihydrouridine synthase A